MEKREKLKPHLLLDFGLLERAEIISLLPAGRAYHQVEKGPRMEAVFNWHRFFKMVILSAGKGMAKHFQEEYKLVPYF